MRSLLIVLALMLSFTANGAERLFQISRSLNKNIVCYDVQLNNGKLNTSSPIHVYWHNNEDHPGHENDLSFIERKFAYGYKVVKATANEATVQMTAYHHRNLTLCQLNGKWVCLITIAGEQCVLTEIYVKSRPKLPTSVEYLELRGKSVSTGQTKTEKVKGN